MKNAWIIVIIIAILAATAIFTKGFGLINSAKPTSVISSVTGDEEIKIPLSEISEEVKFYDYNSNGIKIKFFAVKANDGSIKTGFDACDICYRAKKGYRQEGNYLVCNNCAKRFPIDGLGTENKNPGGCWPGYLQNSISDGNLVIKKEDLENNQWRFA